MSNKMKKLQEGISSSVGKAINKDNAESLKAKEDFDFNVQWIDIDKVVANEYNFYEVREIEILADDIYENGLYHNLVVNKESENKYIIISGERRFKAITLLNETGRRRFKKLPCKIITKNEIESQIRLIQSNALARVLTDFETMVQVAQLKILYEAKKQKGEKFDKHIRAKIAETLNVSASKVNRLDAISQSIDPLKQALKENKIGTYNASQLARLTAKGQEVAIDIIENSEEPVDVEELKKDIQKIEKQPMTQKSFDKEMNKLKEEYISNAEKEEIKNNNAVIKKIKALSNKIDKITCEVSHLNKIEDDLSDVVNILESSLLGLKEEIALISKNNNEDNK